ncbi:hypothetical protein Acry_3556 (plasmid) [Acidiphilium cryptum JF-5]|uniref:Uncharacterized protein n=2 Tax=Acidiphilium cryptum TaxID=524 RepID=A5FU72_ACICJ|nr:hypothetical protein Acry_3556 [Acidiphilium cryptum JF-5]
MDEVLEMGDDDEEGFSVAPDDRETPGEAAEYRSAVAQAAIAHLGGNENALPCICARCPAAIWTIGDARTAPITESGEIARASDQAPWTIAVFCRAMHKDMTAFAPDYKKLVYVVRGGAVVGFCDAYADELMAWQDHH